MGMSHLFREGIALWKCPPSPETQGTCQKSGGHFLRKKKRLRQRSQPLRASKNMGAIFLKKKGACGNVVSRSGLPKIWGPFFWKKRRLRQRSQPLRASKIMGAIFLKKKSACGNVVSRSGLPEIWWGLQKYGGNFSEKKKAPAAT